MGFAVALCSRRVGFRPTRRCVGFGRRPVLSLLARLASDLLVPDSPDLLLAASARERGENTESGNTNKEEKKAPSENTR